MKFRNLMVREEVFELIDLCEKIYLKYHPEMKHLHLPKSKILYEAMKYYITTEPQYKNFFNDEGKK